MTEPLSNYALIADTSDNVAVAKIGMPSGTSLSYGGIKISAVTDIKPGQRIALQQFNKGECFLQYGQPFGTATGDIPLGGLVGDPSTFSNEIPESETHISLDHKVEPPQYFDRSEIRKFDGYVRPDGRVGTRNYFLVIPVSFCANQIAREISAHYDGNNARGLDGIIALNNNSGCGCGPARRDVIARILVNYALHPNVGGVLFVENGCEQTCFQYLKEEFRKYDAQKPVGWLSLQSNSCNMGYTIEEGIRLVTRQIAQLGTQKRVSIPISELVLGTECGGSDAFSGFSGNAVLGRLSDYLVQSYGTVILTEIPEFWGAHHLLAKRGKDAKVAGEILEFVNWYKRYAEDHGDGFEQNPSPGNIAGGILNIVLKSLAAIKKGGTTRVEGTIQYGERVTGNGLQIMQGPGGDIESSTGVVASGANLIGFTTGRGTPYGNPIVPVIKIANTDEVYRRSDIFDYCAGPIISGNRSVKAASEELLEVMIRTASGQKTRSEIHGANDFIIWFGNTVSL